MQHNLARFRQIFSRLNVSLSLYRVGSIVTKDLLDLPIAQRHLGKHPTQGES